MPDLTSAQRDAACPGPAMLAAYVDGTLDPPAREAVERHLAACESCSEVVAEIVLTRDALSAAGTPADSTRPAVVPMRAARMSPKRWLVAGGSVLAAAAALTLVVRLEPQWLPWNRDSQVDPALSALVTA